ncbi:MAG: hypothetical protein ABIG89_03615 [Candidatus Woesearchaeota archaeon]
MSSLDTLVKLSEQHPVDDSFRRDMLIHRVVGGVGFFLAGLAIVGGGVYSWSEDHEVVGVGIGALGLIFGCGGIAEIRKARRTRSFYNSKRLLDGSSAPENEEDVFYLLKNNYSRSTTAVEQVYGQRVLPIDDISGLDQLSTYSIPSDDLSGSGQRSIHSTHDNNLLLFIDDVRVIGADRDETTRQEEDYDSECGSTTYNVTTHYLRLTLERAGMQQNYNFTCDSFRPMKFVNQFVDTGKRLALLLAYNHDTTEDKIPFNINRYYFITPQS